MAGYQTVLETRTIAEELMDGPDVSPDDYAVLLADLAQVTQVTLGRGPVFSFLTRALAGHRSFRLLDVGFGDGDMLRAIAHWAARYNLTCELVGIDLNPKSAEVARSLTLAGSPIRYVTGDYDALRGEGFDFVISSLVAHHMTHDQLIHFLQFMSAEAKGGWLINDLHRHIFAWFGFPLLANIMRWHPIVRHDGRLSIARSYQPQEWPAILQEAGVDDARVYRTFPFRLCVEQIR